jgi:hypothetical protein
MQDKVFILKVSSDDYTYRTIEIQGSDTLYKLAETILQSFDFDIDSAFGFYSNVNNIYNSDEIYELFADDESNEPKNANVTGVKKTKITDVFAKDKILTFLFDYTEEWLFMVECEEVKTSDSDITYPRIIQKAGQSPDQYGEQEDDYDQ